MHALQLRCGTDKRYAVFEVGNFRIHDYIIVSFWSFEQKAMTSDDNDDDDDDDDGDMITTVMTVLKRNNYPRFPVQQYLYRNIWPICNKTVRPWHGLKARSGLLYRPLSKAYAHSLSPERVKKT